MCYSICSVSYIPSSPSKDFKNSPPESIEGLSLKDKLDMKGESIADYTLKEIGGGDENESCLWNGGLVPLVPLSSNLLR